MEFELFWSCDHGRRRPWMILGTLRSRQSLVASPIHRRRGSSRPRIPCSWGGIAGVHPRGLPRQTVNPPPRQPRSRTVKLSLVASPPMARAAAPSVGGSWGEARLRAIPPSAIRQETSQSRRPRSRQLLSALPPSSGRRAGPPGFPSPGRRRLRRLNRRRWPEQPTEGAVGVPSWASASSRP